MRLADYIEDNAATIVDAAEVFASVHCPRGVHLDREALRDHLPEILAFVVADLRGAQTGDDELARAEGRRDTPPGTPSAAQTHGSLRAKAGFNIDQLVAEYRALRASVLRLWIEGERPGPDAFDDMVRFNQAIDQAVAESVAHFAAEADAWRDIFLGVLGHDLRGPLTAILLTSEILSQMTLDTPLSSHATRLMASGKRMNVLLDDLLDFSRSNLGLGIRISRSDTDLTAELRDEVEMLRMAWPSTPIEFDAPHAVEGNFDGSRLREALANLVNNAAQHGTVQGKVRIGLEKNDGHVVLTVQNSGTAIPAAILATMFEPLRRGSISALRDVHLGLGLFVVRQITRAHGGDITAESSGDETHFTMRFPAAPPG
jgi:signal transduction histidine kinase